MARVVLVILAVAKLLVVIHGQQGLILSLRGNTVAGGSDVLITDVGEGREGDAGLICTTDEMMCCNSAASGGTRRGDWIFPNNDSSIGPRSDGGDFYVTRNSQRQVILNRRNNALGPLGMYCCEVLSVAHPGGTTICVNIVTPPLTVMLSGSGSQTAGESYTFTCIASGGGSGTTTYQWRKGQTLLNGQISQTLTFSRLRQDDTGGYTCTVMRGSMTTTSNTVIINVGVGPPLTVMLSGSGSQTAGESYTFTCTASGGGSGTTTYQWHKNQTLLNGQTSQTLTFSRLSQADTGGYTCTVMRGFMTTTSNIVIINARVPTISVAVRGSGTPTEDRQYTLTCIVSGHQALMATVTYRWLNNSNFITSGQTSNQYTFNPVVRYDNGTYTCEVTVNSALLNNNIVRQNSTTFQVTVLKPERPSFGSPTQNSRSIGLSWTQPASGGRADSYTIVYTVTERNCNAQSQGGTRTLPETLPGAQRSITIDNLEENSDIRITITATNIRGSSLTVTTPTTSRAIPTGRAQNLTITNVTSGTIRVQWDAVSCLERNGVITGYRIQYGITTTSESSQTLGTGRTFVASGLRLLTTYMFRVAAINSNGIGPFSDTISRRTLLSPVVTLWHNGAAVSNQSIVSLEEIRGGSDLFCLTNYDTGSSRVGSWYYPDGTEVPQSGTSQFVRSRGRSFVALSSSGMSTPPSGLYRCVIPDLNGQEVTLFSAIYTNSQGAPFLPVPLQYNFARRTINCTSSGGPVTTVEWTVDNGELPSNTQEQQLIDTETATYYNLLTITSRNIRDYTIRYICRVRNSRGESFTRSLTPDAVEITGNMEFQLGETTNITCSAPVPVQSIQWVDESNTVVRNGVAVQELRLDIMITTSSNNTRYTCRVSDSAGIVTSLTVSIRVKGLMCEAGTYIASLAGGNSTCRQCPENSDSISDNSLECICLQGYYRNVLEDVNVPCTRAPSACRNLLINSARTRANSVRIEWERPLITGRNDYYYNIYYSSNPDQPGSFTKHNPTSFVRTSPRVGYSVSGLSPLTNYTIRVTVLNGVSEQDSGGEEASSCEVTATTGDIRPHAPRSVTSFCTVIVWQAPARVYGFIAGYHLRLSSSDTDSGVEQEVMVTKNRDEEFHKISEDDLPRGNGEIFVEVRVITLFTEGIWSDPVPLGNSLYVQSKLFTLMSEFDADLSSLPHFERISHFDLDL